MIVEDEDPVPIVLKPPQQALDLLAHFPAMLVLLTIAAVGALSLAALLAAG